MKRKDALKTIKIKLEEGLTKQKIYKELLSKVKFKSDLVQYMAMLPSYEDRQKYKTLNMILFSLLVFISISKLIIAALLLGKISLLIIPFALIVPFLSVYFAVMIWNFYGNMYRPLGLLGIVGISKGLSNLPSLSSYSSLQLSLDLLFGFLPAITIVLLAFYIGTKVFPHYGFFGKINEDKLGIRV